MGSDNDEKTKENSDDLSDTGNLFQSSWLRCSLRLSDELDKILSDNRYYFLLHLNILFLFVLDYFKKK
jgi:hypothetical protein